MIGFIIRKIVGSKNDREVRRLRPLVAKINEIESALQAQPPEVLREKTAAWKERLCKTEDNAELTAALDEILPEAFAAVKNACRRLCGQEIVVRTSQPAADQLTVGLDGGERAISEKAAAGLFVRQS